MEQLEKIQFVSLTTDICTSKKYDQLHDTVHFTDRNFKMQSKVLSTVHVPESHTALNLKIRMNE